LAEQFRVVPTRPQQLPSMSPAAGRSGTVIGSAPGENREVGGFESRPEQSVAQPHNAVPSRTTAASIAENGGAPCPT